MALLTLEGLTNEWIPVGDDAPLPERGVFTVSIDRFGREHARWSPELLVRSGVHLDAAAEIEALGRLLLEAPRVVLHFGKMVDGRPFSQARTLRTRLGYRGSLVARGPLIADQFPLLRRCGFDGVEIPAGADPEVWLRALSRHRGQYQPDPGGAPAAV